MSDFPQSKAPVSNFNLPNALTVLRLILVPIFICLMLLEGEVYRWASLGVFIGAAVTDQLDGELARRWNMITDFGKIADPIADKALVLSAMVLLSVQAILPWWITAIILVRELGITILRFFMLRRAVMAASRGGKIKTVTQMIFVTGMLVPWGAMITDMNVVNGLAWLFYLVALLAVTITVVTGLEYLWSASQIAKRKSSTDQEQTTD